MTNVEMRLKESKNQFIEKIADNMQSFGVSETIGRVLGIIYMNREPMTLDQLSEATGMSKMRMSQVVREMIELNIAKKVFKKGVRKDLIQVEDDYYQTFISLFTSNWQRAVSKSRSFEHRLRTNLDTIELDDSQSEEVIEEKEQLNQETEKWSDYYDWINRLIDFFESGDIFEHVPINERGNKHDK